MRTPRRRRNRLPRAFALALAIFLLSGCGDTGNIRAQYSGAGALAGDRLTVMTYNIRIGAGTDDLPKKKVRELRHGPEKLQPIIEAIKSVDPDILALQEVRGEGQARRLARALRMNFAFEWHGTNSLAEPWWGVAILSKYEILTSRGVEISSGDRNTKCIVMATLDLGGRQVTAISVHKDKDLEDGGSFRILMKEVSRIEQPVVLMGDFNVDPDDGRLHLLKPRFTDTAMAVNSKDAVYVREQGTFFANERRIDYVFVDPRRFKTWDVGLIPYAHWEASDHLGYYARISLMP